LGTSLAGLNNRIEYLITSVREEGDKLKEKLIVSSSAASDELLKQKKTDRHKNITSEGTIEPC
jgi:hypothetical protein